MFIAFCSSLLAKAGGVVAVFVAVVVVDVDVVKVEVEVKVKVIEGVSGLGDCCGRDQRYRLAFEQERALSLVALRAWGSALDGRMRTRVIAHSTTERRFQRPPCSTALDLRSKHTIVLVNHQ